MDVLELLFVKYWPQISFVVLGFVYIAKVAISTIYKKKEIEHSIFQQSKIDAIKNFNTAYSEAVICFANIPYYQILKNELSVDKIDEVIQPVLKKLKIATDMIGLFCNQKMHEKLNIVAENVYIINKKLLDLYFDEQKISITKKANDFCFFREENIKQSNIILQKTTEKYRPKF
jgi:hypothetical protein